MAAGKKPLISLVIISYNMTRELPRTLATLTAPYQQGVEPDDIEIIVVDNGSNVPLETANFPENINFLVNDVPAVSPVRAVNLGLKAARAGLIGVLIDGARMASPGLCKYALLASKLHPRPVISTLGFHLGSERQMDSVENGYNQAAEDKLLESIDWREDGYELFNVSVFAGSSQNGWFMSITESNALFLTREMWNELDGYDERFILPGGGLANMDAYVRACELFATELITLLGEGTFHQVHGGIATNQKDPAASLPVFHEEYISIRNKHFVKPEKDSLFLGKLPLQARASIKLSGEALMGETI